MIDALIVLGFWAPCNPLSMQLPGGIRQGKCHALGSVRAVSCNVEQQPTVQCTKLEIWTSLSSRNKAGQAVALLHAPIVSICCSWTAEEGASYLHWLASVETARARTRQPWKLDLSWLVDQDIPIPDTLAEHCSPG